MESGILYVVFNEWISDPKTDEMPYKIGITRNSVDDRYYGLGLKMPGKFETLFAYKIKDYAKAEQSIQSILNKKCVNGEWFKLDRKDIDFIKEICERMDGVLITEEIDNEIKDETEDATDEENSLSIDTNKIQVVEAYLIDGLSYRDIERKILNITSPTRGGGYKVMEILHNLGIDTNKKGILKNKPIEKEIEIAKGEYLKILNLLRNKI